MKYLVFNICIRCIGSGGGLLSIWREGTDEIELLQTQALAEQPVCALDWCPDKKGKIYYFITLKNYCFLIIFKRNVFAKSSNLDFSQRN